jgi:hypothetical protein
MLSVLLVASADVCAQGAQASPNSPLPSSNYSVRHVCTTPSSGNATCLALQLVPETTAAKEHTHPIGTTTGGPVAAASAAAGAFGLTPSDLHTAYQLPTTASSIQTVALVDAYNDPAAEADLSVYEKEFGLSCGGCFDKVNQSGEATNLPFPQTVAERNAAREGSNRELREEAEESEGWAGETSLDIEATRAICENCHILLVEADSQAAADLEAAERTAADLGATEISNSFGSSDQGETASADSASAYNHPGIVITAGSGDSGYLNWDSVSSSERGYADYPASSPYVIAVGGTRLYLDEGARESESVWNGYGASGGGCSSELTAQAWQQDVDDWLSVGCGDKRAVADVSADGDPYTGVAIYNSTVSTSECEDHWCTYGGTSLSAPLIAAVYALAGGAHGVAYPASTLYEREREDPASLHDVVEGSDGKCSSYDAETGVSNCSSAEEASASDCASQLICLAAVGYDGPSGVGTPNGTSGFEPVVSGGDQSTTTTSSESSSTSSSTSTSTTEPNAASPAPAVAVVLSRLALTRDAKLALNRRRRKALALAFSFIISASARVHVTLAERARKGGASRWHTLPDSLTIHAVTGRNARHLTGRNVLTAGVYRLTVKPSTGNSVSIIFKLA